MGGEPLMPPPSSPTALSELLVLLGGLQGLSLQQHEPGGSTLLACGGGGGEAALQAARAPLATLALADCDTHQPLQLGHPHSSHKAPAAAAPALRAGHLSHSPTAGSPTLSTTALSATAAAAAAAPAPNPYAQAGAPYSLQPAGSPLLSLAPAAGAPFAQHHQALLLGGPQSSPGGSPTTGARDAAPVAFRAAPSALQPLPGYAQQHAGPAGYLQPPMGSDPLAQSAAGLAAEALYLQQAGQYYGSLGCGPAHHNPAAAAAALPPGAGAPFLQQQQQQQRQQQHYAGHPQAAAAAYLQPGPGGVRGLQLQPPGAQLAAGQLMPTQMLRSPRKAQQHKDWDRIRRTVYVRGLGPQTGEVQLAEFFRDCGVVADCRVCGEPHGSMRFAFIEFQNEESAHRALSKSGHMLGPQELQVSPSKTAIVPVKTDFLPSSVSEREAMARTIYVANIDRQVERETLHAFFSRLCGPVSKLRLLADTHHSSKIAFVEFSDLGGALKALDCSGALLGTQPLRIFPSKTPVRLDGRGSGTGSRGSGAQAAPRPRMPNM